MGVLERVRADFAQVSQRDTTLSVDEWSALFQFGGLTYPLIQTTMGNVREERIVGSTIAAHHGNLAVFALVMARIQAFSQIRFQWTRFDGAQPGDLFGTPELDILEHPWPQGHTMNLLARMELDNSIAGNAYVVRPRKNRLARMRPDLVTIVLGSQDEPDDPADADDVEVAGYVYWRRGAGGAKFYFPEEVAHYASTPDPNFQFLGMSWLTPAIREVQADSLAVEHKARFFQNAATPNLAIKFDPTVPIELVKQFKQLAEEEHKGAFNAYKTLYLGGGADPVTVGKDFQQLDFAVTQGHGEGRLAAAAGVPASWVGFSEGLQGSALNASTFNNQRRRLSDGTMYHLWGCAAHALEAVCPPPDRHANLWFDMRVPFMREDASDQAAIQQQEAGIITELVREGFTPDSVVKALRTNDWSQLKHSGLMSVQLQKPGVTPPAPAGRDSIELNGTTVAVPAAVEELARRAGGAYQKKVATVTGSYTTGHKDHDAVPAVNVPSTTAHLLESTSHDLAHARRHFHALKDAPDDAGREFNAEHMTKHLESASDHLQRLASHMRDRYPEEGHELVQLEEAHPADMNSKPVYKPGADTSDEPAATVNSNGSGGKK